MAGVQALRLLAALLVLIHHSYVLPAFVIGGGVPRSFEYLQFGAIGVYLFFAISGYVIARQADMVPTRFALHRCLRIYPPYVAALFIGATLMFACGSMNVAEVHFDPSLLLIPFGHLQSWPAIPYWTLVCEMFFYFVAFCLMCAGPRAYDAGLVAWTVIVLAGSWLNPFLEPPPADVISLATSPLCLIFIAGAVYARLETGRHLPAAAVMLISMLTIYYAVPGSKAISATIAAAAAIGLIHLAIICERAFSGKIGSLLARGGDYSYGLYLIHYPIIIFVAMTIGKSTSVLTAAALAAPISAVAGLAFGAWEFRVYRKYLRPAADAMADSFSALPRPSSAQPQPQHSA